ncbi:hypothetical protein RhiirB3_406764 [Rhizophagus irregularis]|nr:hypothetical protein RhiirB3_406764 [Rhizophagus irregularis]
MELQEKIISFLGLTLKPILYNDIIKLNQIVNIMLEFRGGVTQYAVMLLLLAKIIILRRLSREISHKRLA